MDEIEQFFHAQKMFAGLPQPALQALAGYARRREMHQDEQLLMQGEPASPAYFVAHGQVRVYRLSPSGREQALMDVGPGQAFNLVAALDSRPAPSSAMARTDGLLLSVNPTDFHRVLRAQPALAEAVLIDFAGRLRQLTSLVEDLSLRSVPQRLARLLLQMGQPDASPGRFTHQELAVRLGTVREVISRTLRNFERDGLITLDRHRIIIADRPRLAALAEDE